MKNNILDTKATLPPQEPMTVRVVGPDAHTAATFALTEGEHFLRVVVRDGLCYILEAPGVVIAPPATTTSPHGS